MEETKKLEVHDGDKSEFPLTADEKKVRRDIYIANRLAVVSQAKIIEDIEAGRRESVPGTTEDIEWLRQSTARARQLVAKLAPLFADDPNIEMDIMETKCFLDNLATALGEKKDTGE